MKIKALQSPETQVDIYHQRDVTSYNNLILSTAQFSSTELLLGGTINSAEN